MEIVRLAQVDSTNSEARRLLAAGKPAPFAVLADEQTAGRGTQGRSWSSPRGAGIYLSIVPAFLRPWPIHSMYSVAAGIACAEVLLDRLGVTIELKPPNDLYQGGRKLGGILVETSVRGDALASLVVGIGINVLQVPHRTDGRVRTTSLQELLPHLPCIEIMPIVGDLLVRVPLWLGRPAENDVQTIEASFKRWRMREPA